MAVKRKLIHDVVWEMAETPTKIHLASFKEPPFVAKPIAERNDKNHGAPPQCPPPSMPQVEIQEAEETLESLLASIPVPTDIPAYVMLLLEKATQMDSQTPSPMVSEMFKCHFHDVMLERHTSKHGWAYVMCPLKTCPFWKEDDRAEAVGEAV